MHFFAVGLLYLLLHEPTIFARRKGRGRRSRSDPAEDGHSGSKPAEQEGSYGHDAPGGARHDAPSRDFNAC